MPIYNLRIPLPKRYRAKITKAILDRVETLPKTQNPYIGSLQSDREHHREQAESTFNRSRAPQNAQLEYLTIRMVEVFQLEEFEKLRINLKKMFPDLGGFHGNETFEDYFGKLGSSLHPGWWMNVGLIYRDKPRWGRNTFRLPSLPETVDSIQVDLHKIFPSLIAITLDIHLNSNANDTLIDLHTQKYLPEASLESFHPMDKSFGISQMSAERSMEQALLGWLEGIRKGVEDSIKPHISGYFMQQSTDFAKLPAIEVYSLKRNERRKTKFATWANNAHDWFDSLGFQLYWNTYNNKSFAFSWSHKSNYADNNKIPSRILLFWDEFIKDVNLEMYSGNERYAATRMIRNFLDSMLIPFIAIEFLSEKIERIKKHRVNVFTSMVKKLVGSSNLRKQLKHHAALQEERRAVERFILEFDQNKERINKKMREDGLESLTYTNLIDKREPPYKNLNEAFMSEINYLRNTYKEHMSFLNTAFSEYIQMLNVDAMYGLQIVTIWLSFIALVVAVLGVLGNWDSILGLFK
jgi:hypothetical protein